MPNVGTNTFIFGGYNSLGVINWNSYTAHTNGTDRTERAGWDEIRHKSSNKWDNYEPIEAST